MTGAFIKAFIKAVVVGLIGYLLGLITIGAHIVGAHIHRRLYGVDYYTAYTSNYTKRTYACIMCAVYMFIIIIMCVMQISDDDDM